MTSHKPPANLSQPRRTARSSCDGMSMLGPVKSSATTTAVPPLDAAPMSSAAAAAASHDTAGATVTW